MTDIVDIDSQVAVIMGWTVNAKRHYLEGNFTQ